MPQYFDLSYTELLDQSRMTADSWFRWAVSEIDEKFGKGYAKEHPELIIAYMHCAKEDFLQSSAQKFKLDNELREIE